MGTLSVEVFDTPESRALGLMNRDSLPQDRGALFLFDVPEVLGFWMKDTTIPLDIAFINPDWRISSIKRLEPGSLQQVSSNEQCVAAIEANAEWFAQNQVGEGAKVVWDGTGIDFEVEKTGRFAEYDYHFIVWSDCYGPTSIRDDLLAAIQQDEERALVVCVGDYVKIPSDEGLKKIRKLFDGHFGQDGWISTPGNHEAQMVDGKLDNLDWYESRIGSARDVRTINNDTFIMLNSSFKKVLPEDFSWFELELAKAVARGGRIFVASHLPFLDTVPPHENDEDHGLPEGQAAILIRMMEEYGVTAVFSSHQHGYETWFRNNVVYVGSAAGGSPKDEEHERYGYVEVHVGEVTRIEKMPLYPIIPEEVRPDEQESLNG